MFPRFWGSLTPDALEKERVVPNTIIDIPAGTYSVDLTCDWSEGSGSTSSDVDLSAVLFGPGDKDVDWADVKKRHVPGVRHGGDGNNGDLVFGRRETVVVTFSEMPAAVKDAYICVVSSTGKQRAAGLPEMCMWLKSPQVDRVIKVANNTASGYLFGRFRKVGDDHWQFETLGTSKPDCVKWQDLQSEINKAAGFAEPTPPPAPAADPPAQPVPPPQPAAPFTPPEVAFKEETPQPPVVPKAKVVFLEETLDVPGNCSNLHVGCGWDSHGDKDVDIDISAIMFDAGDGEIAIVDFREKAAPGIHHSGDDLSGNASGDDESITIDLGAVPADAREIFFCITVFTEGLAFEQIKNLHCHLVWPGVDKFYPVEAAGKNGVVFGRLGKDGDKWSFQTFGASREGCLTWRDLKDVMRMLRRTYPVVQPRRVWHPVEAKVPGDVDVVEVGYAWDDDAGKVDVDLSTLMFDGSGANPVQVVDFKTKSCQGAVHSGDTRQGLASGENEVVKVILSEVPSDVSRIVFTATIFTPDAFFDTLGDTYFRLCFGGREVGKYPVSAPGRKNGYIFGELQRKPDGWEFVSVNVPKEGCMSWADLRGDISRACFGGKRAMDVDESPASKRRKSLEGGSTVATVTN